MSSRKISLLADRYRIESEIGRGGMGIVYKAWDTLKHTRVAVKILPYGEEFSHRAIRFQREYQALARLPHPHVVQVYESGRAKGDFSFILPGRNFPINPKQGCFYFVMELIQGINFRRYFCAPLDFSDKERVKNLFIILSQLCEALQYIHANRIVHRDLKPENLLISTVSAHKPQIKILDFGLVRDSDSLDPFHVEDKAIGKKPTRGTAAYMSPEQAKSESVDHRSDLYSLGIILYEIISGQLPFFDRNSFRLMMMHVSESTPCIADMCPNLPPGLDKLISKLLAKTREERYQSAADLWRDLKDILAPLLSPGGADFSFSPADFTIAPSKNRLIYGRGYPVFAPALAGRDNEWEVLSDILDDKSPTLIFIQGGLGTGKTRLIRKLQTHARLNRSALFVGNCRREEPYSPFVAILNQIERQLAPIADESSYIAANKAIKGSEKIARNVLKQIKQVMPILQNKPGRFFDISRLWITGSGKVHSQYVAILQRAARLTPVILAIEDIHQIDAASSELLEYLIKQTGPLFSIVGTYRDHDSEAFTKQDHGLRIKNLFDEKTRRIISLQPLNITEVGQMIRSMLGQDMDGEDKPGEINSAPAMIKRIWRQTDGNPFFIEEIVKSLVDAGALYRTEKGWELQTAYLATDHPSSQMTVPKSVHEAISKRLDRLSPQARSIANYAAIFGDSFTFPQLERLVNFPDKNELERGLDDLLKSGLILEEEEKFKFSHSLVQVAVYGELDPDWKRDRHLIAAEMIAQEHNVSEKYSVIRLDTPLSVCRLLSYHYAEAGRKESAIYYLLSAAHACSVNFSQTNAALYYKLAKKLSDQNESESDAVKDEEFADFLLLMFTALQGELARSAGSYPEARKFYEIALGKVQEKNGRYHLEDIMAFHGKIALTYQSEHLNREAVAHYRKCMEINQKLSESSSSYQEKITAPYLINLGVLHKQMGRYASAIQYYEQALKIIEKYPMWEFLISVNTNLGNCYQNIGKFDEAESCMRRAYDHAERIGEKRRKGDALYNLGRMAAMKGKLSPALEQFRKCRALFEASGDLYRVIMGDRIIGEVYLEKGAIADAYTCHLSCFEKSEEAGILRTTVITRLDLIYDLLVLHKYDRIETELLKSEQEMERFQNSPYHFRRVLYQGEYDLAVGKTGSVPDRLQELRKFPQEIVDGNAGKIDSLDARLALSQGDYDQAVQLFSSSEKFFQVNYHIYDLLESKIFMLLTTVLSGGQLDAQQFDRDAGQLIEREGFLRLARLAGFILSHDQLIEALTPERTEALVWGLQEEVDCSEIPDIADHL